MAWTVNKKRTFTREIEDPESGEKATIEIRKLTEGDFQDRDGLSISMRLEQKGRKKGRKARKQANEPDVDYTPGRVRLFEIERGLVSWTIPHPANPDTILPLNTMTIKSLDSAIAKQIHDHIVELNPYFFESPEDLEDEEDDDIFDEDDQDDEDEVSEADFDPADFEPEDESADVHEFPNDSGDGQDTREFGQTDGPKERAATS